MERNKNDIDFPGKIAILLKEYRAISIKAEGGFVKIELQHWTLNPTTMLKLFVKASVPNLLIYQFSGRTY
jgi:hypothetical protein